MSTVPASQVGISIPTQLIEDIVRAEIVRSLGDQTALIEGIVRAAITAKQPNSYSDRDPTIFMKQAQEMIRKVATEALQEWIEQNRQKIKDALFRHLQSKDGAPVKKLVESFTEGLGRYSISVGFNWKD